MSPASTTSLSAARLRRSSNGSSGCLCPQVFPALWCGEEMTDPDLGMEGAFLGAARHLPAPPSR
jgi:hypothetical protein